MTKTVERFLYIMVFPLESNNRTYRLDVDLLIHPFLGIIVDVTHFNRQSFPTNWMFWTFYGRINGRLGVNGNPGAMSMSEYTEIIL